MNCLRTLAYDITIAEIRSDCPGSAVLDFKKHGQNRHELMSLEQFVIFVLSYINKPSNRIGWHLLSTPKLKIPVGEVGYLPDKTPAFRIKVPKAKLEQAETEATETVVYDYMTFMEMLFQITAHTTPQA